MAWITGTATDFKDLLDRLQAAVTSNGWTVQSYTTGSALPYTDQLIMQGPGFGSGYEVQLGLRTYEDDTNNFFCFEGYGFTTYDSSRLLLNQINISPKVVTRLWNASIPFWLSISDRRIILIAKCSNTYHSLYMGFIDPFSSPIEYPYPFYLASDAGTYGQYGDTAGIVATIAMPAKAGAFFRDPSGIWCRVSVYADDGAGGVFTPFGNQFYTIWPYMSPGQAGSPPSTWFEPPYQQFEVTPTVDSLPMMNTYMMACFNKGGVQGVLEGVTWLPGHGLSAEQELTVGGDTYIVFINIARSTEQPSSFYAIKEA